VSDEVGAARARLVSCFEDFRATPHDRRIGLLTDDWMARHFTEDVEWKAPGFDFGTFRGFDGSRQFWRQWLEPWRSLDFSYEVTRVGNRIVVWITDQEMEGQTSGAKVHMQDYAWVCWARDGRISRVEFVFGRQAAEAAARADS
jgi:hypothetical protein